MKDNLTTQLPEKTTTAYYQVAGLNCAISFPKPVFVDKILRSSASFRCFLNKNDKFASEIIVSDACCDIDLAMSNLLTEVKGTLGDNLQLYENELEYFTVISYENDQRIFTMVSNRDFSKSTVYLNLDDSLAESVLTSFFMVAFSQMAVLHNTILIHASVVDVNGDGFAFLGKSGTGKSTHSSLWLKYIAGTSLLNDDNPALQIDADGNALIWGTPWSGKTPCYRNKKARLKALVRLQQAPENKIAVMNGSNAMVAILPSCSSLRWNDDLYASLCDVIERVIEKVSVCFLKCLPDKAAAELCYKKINDKQN